ncbi:Aste57867_14644 [Aphanomyces stellatus]|uniref:Aste57867_14644 protein n=1 Tax=Aphanomyces stellatus TaxID=120398 RepID=A0A485L177_9STRA|nr:hypothetical protein As57867_014589 [Aphanomyces stellatus]VFT91463.1 Aste57867_14644 [Aphanomyces stellatus]
MLENTFEFIKEACRDQATANHRSFLLPNVLRSYPKYEETIRLTAVQITKSRRGCVAGFWTDCFCGKEEKDRHFRISNETLIQSMAKKKNMHPKHSNHGSYYTSGLHGLHEEATPTEILVAFTTLKRRRWAIEDKRSQVDMSLNVTHPPKRVRKQVPASTETTTTAATPSPPSPPLPPPSR